MDHGLSHASDGIADGVAAVCTAVKGSHMVASQSTFDLTRDMLAGCVYLRHSTISIMTTTTNLIRTYFILPLCIPISYKTSLIFPSSTSIITSPHLLLLSSMRAAGSITNTPKYHRWRPTLYIDCRLETSWDRQASLSASTSTSTWISSPTGLSRLASSRLGLASRPLTLPEYFGLVTTQPP
ncbi:hypothetical protein COCCADRAFT_27250 [Bipolaris zeicola 26-R-13]|uniref:Uncharacterized protein n=1 Tax=Cochliobolus carbonum (strain 26-R-13) TaxID=930089 RepID=W6Y3G4_COCC2|nr:uncharacterized protein COCCADRAFT_27250 [Bipolaris zeicola 26-R-13]EUC32165.1 hypothetical protein COCCADRAFT_27250 [Bipolaris zeicola 26-R-13]